VVLLLPGTRPAPGAPLDEPLVVRLREALDASQEMILVVEPSGRVLFANETARAGLGLANEDATFRALEMLLDGPRADEVWGEINLHGEWQGDLATTLSDGSPVRLDLTLLAEPAKRTAVHSLTVVAHDVGEQRALEDALAHRATHDGLTGLANRQHLLSALNEALPELHARQQSGALLLIDIDEFRTVTNSLGHEAGDRVLVAFAYRLLRTFPSSALLARVGGDEFAVFCPGAEDVEALAEQTERTTAAPFYIDGTEVHLSVVTGMALTTPDTPTVNAEALLREADAAAYRAKERGRGTFEMFEPHLQAEAVDRLALVQDLRRALRNNELRVHYQPKIDLATGAMTGAEALLRWQAPDGTLRGPAEFMQVAEDTGLIIPMGRWILHEVCRTAAEVNAEAGSHAPLSFSVNMSVRQLDHPSCAGDVEDAVAASGVDPRLIELEVTESALMTDVEVSAQLLTRLKRLGVRIAVDDFGTGYSSLQYLQRLPVDVLKIDKTFVAGLGDSAGDLAIVSAIVQLAQALELTSVAEGVETPEQLTQLRELGCIGAQGYHIARPMPLDGLLDLIGKNTSWT
jgi:diguanylate cyclase (GGDEF)-like protein